MLHHGHAKLLVRAAAFGSLYVGVNSDRFVAKYKRVLPTENERIRLERMRSFFPVDVAFLNDGPGVNLIRLVKPDLLVIGSDWHDRYLTQIDITHGELFDELGCGVVYLPRTPGVSTTELRA